MKKAVSMAICFLMVLSSVLFTAPPATAEASKKISGKTGQGAADFAQMAYSNGWKYVYGAYGQVITKELVDGFRKTFPGMYTESYYNKTLKAVGSRGVDCVGLLKAYLWWQGSGSNPKPAGNVAGSSTAMYNEASEKGPMSTMPDEPGIILYRPGHVGIYVGGGYVIDASGVDYGIKKNNQLSKWRNWFRSPYLTYSGKSASGSSKPGGGSESSGDVLKKGASGDAVVTLQKRLKELGYFDGTADGDFGGKTEEAVKAFQKKAGLTPDGVAGQATQKKLYASGAPKANSSGSNKSPATSTSTGSVSNTAVYSIGSTGSGITKLQARLKELGYFKAQPTGTFGEKTRIAVCDFQKAVGISVTGIADQKTQDKLYASSAPKRTTNTTQNVNVVKLSAKPSETLRPGDEGDEVKSLQTRLKELGYITGNVDGTFGAGTETAVKEFQEAVGLTADGVAGSTTLDKLFASDAPKKGGASASSYTKLEQGDSGEKVTNLQNRLIELGYFDAEADGKYSDSTVAAVKAFQETAGLTADGVAGVKTQEALFAGNAPSKVTSSSSEPESSSSEAPAEPVSSELPQTSDNTVSDEPADVTEISTPEETSMEIAGGQDSTGMIKHILIICIGAAVLVIVVIIFLERRKKSMTTARVIRKDEEQ